VNIPVGGIVRQFLKDGGKSRFVFFYFLFGSLADLNKLG